MAGPPDGGRESWRCRQPHDPVGPQPAQYVDGQVGQDVGESGDVVAGVDDDQDPRIGGRVVSGGDQALHYAADLDRVTSATSSAGPRRTASRIAFHEVRPVSRAATNEYGQRGISWDVLFARP